MSEYVRTQTWKHYAFYLIFGSGSLALLWYYLSRTLLHFTSPQQFAIDSFHRFPLTILIFPAEVFSICFGLYFVYLLFMDQFRDKPIGLLPNKKNTDVAVLLPVYNEPKEVVERTIKACKKLEWEGKVNIYLLDDSTQKSHKDEMIALAKKYKLHHITRKDREGFKAGNINNAVKNHISEPYFMILDSDQAPEPDFLIHTMDFFSDKKIGFVQTPQHFINDDSPIERATKIGSDIFFSAMCVGKSHDGAIPFCGTNAVIQTKVFKDVNGFRYYTSTEDIELGMRMNEAGYKGAFVSRVLAKGYAPQDMKTYVSQQYRWSNGNLAILRESFFKLITMRFSLRYFIHMIFTLGWWLIGIVTLLYILVPLISLATGLGTHHAWLPLSLIVLLYVNVVFGVGMIYVSLQGRKRSDPMTISDALLQYSLITNSLFIFIRSAINALLLKRYIGFIRTSKKKQDTGLSLISINLILAVVCFAASIFALYNGALAADMLQLRTYLPLSLWLLFYSVVLASSIIFVDIKPRGVSA